jgi:site-specific DNA-methyltransferase (adenine-specific)
MPNIELLNIDCMEYMKGLPDKAFDLAIVDPPYGIGVGFFEPVGGRGEKNKDSKKWDKSIPSEEYFVELRRISKEQIIWGANYFNCFSNGHGAIIWDKIQPLPDSSQCEIASYSRLQKVGLYRQRWTNFVNTKQSSHPTEKPTDLYRWLLKNYAQEGDRILDTHLGSGSSAIAAHAMNFDFVGCEIDKDYYDAACKRFKEQTAQQSLFK